LAANPRLRRLTARACLCVVFRRDLPLGRRRRQTVSCCQPDQLIRTVNKAPARAQRGPAFLAPRSSPPITGSVCLRRPQSGSLSLRMSLPTSRSLTVNPGTCPSLSSSRPRYCRRLSTSSVVRIIFKFIPNEYRPLVPTNLFINNINSVYDLRPFIRRRRIRGATFRFAYSSRPSPVRFIRPEGTIWRS